MAGSGFGDDDGPRERGQAAHVFAGRRGENACRRRVQTAAGGTGRYGSQVTARLTSTPGSSEPYGVLHPALEDAEAEAALAEHRAWVAAGRPGAVSHEEAMAELLRGR